MPTLEDIQATLRAQMPYLCERYHVETLGVFGSYVRGEQVEDSDVDLLVTFSKTPDLLEFVDLADHLEQLLGCKVDVATESSLRERIRARVLREALPL